MQTITLIGYLSRQVNESPPHIWPAPPTHNRVYYPRVSRSRLRTIWFTELAVLCGLSLNGQDWWRMECGDLWVLPKYGPQLALMSSVQILWQTPEMSETQSKCCSLSSPPAPVFVFVEMWWGDTRQHRPLSPDIYQLRAHSAVFVFSRGFFWCLNSSPGVFGWLALLGCMSSNKTEKRSKQIAGGDRSH